MTTANESIRLVNSTEGNEKTYAFYGVDCIVLTQDNRIILQKRGDNWNHFPGYLASFGGQIEAGETPMRALIRELNEELGAQVKESDVVSLGAVTEAITGHTELIHVYFWHDLHGTITGCYEGEVRHFDSTQEVISYPKVMDDTRWALNECIARQLLQENELIANAIKVVNWNKQLEQQAYELLNKHEETSMFLLSNLKTYGPKLTGASYSANFKCLVKDNQVVAVFALTKIGNLLIQTDRRADYSAIIVDECLKEPISLLGIVGEWSLAKQILDYVKNKIPSFNKVLSKKSILFELALSDFSSVNTNFNIRYLEPSDYAGWNSLNKALLSERDLNQNEDESDKYQRFLENTKQKYLFGIFVDNKLASTASFVSCVDKIGQIGDIFTITEMRKKGLAKKLICQLILDGKINKHLEKVILFTGEDNHVAIKLYENIGFKRIGYFGLFFGGH
jgi:8-oxo-dGTP diphosphatase